MSSAARASCIWNGVRIDYVVSPTAAQFHYDRHEYRGLRGPVGSGKSVACCMDIFLNANGQVPVGGVRRSRFLIGRNTFTDLKNTTIKTWMNWFPQTRMHWSPPLEGLLELPCAKNDGTRVAVELLFYALDAPDIINSLMSLELSGVWVNEATQTRFKVIHKAHGRVGRYQPYPGVKLKSFGTIMDTNSPDESNWWHRLERIEKPAEMAFFVQPPALLKRVDPETGKIFYEDNDGRDPSIPAAENVQNLPQGFWYYHKQLIGADDDDVKRLILNQFGVTMEGKPVYPEYDAAVHLHDGGMRYEPGMALLMGTDFGRTPAAVIAQMGVDGQLRVIDEVTADNVSTESFIEEFLRPRLVNKYNFPMCRVLNFADPAGANPDQVVEMTCIQKFNRYGIRTVPASVPQNRFELRRDCVSELLRSGRGRSPAVIVSGDCKVLAKGFNGGYRYRRVRGADERFSDAPEKNEFSHIHDAFQYLCWGAFRMGIDYSAPNDCLGQQFQGAPPVEFGGVDLGGFGA